VCLHLGAGSVLALDTDPEAVAAAREVARANGLAERLRLEQGSLDAARGAPWNGVVVNIAAEFFHRDAVELGALLGPGGSLVASGFLGEDAAAVSASLARAESPPRSSTRSSRGWRSSAARGLMARLWRVHHVGAPPADGDLVELAADEGHYVRKVLRLAAGEDLVLFDGNGGEWAARLDVCDARKVRVRVAGMATALPSRPSPSNCFRGCVARKRWTG